MDGGIDEKRYRKHFGGMEMSVILICADGFTFDHVCKKAHQIILFKYEPFIMCQLYLSLFFFLKKKKKKKLATFNLLTE